MAQIKKPIILKPESGNFYIKEDNSWWFSDKIEDWQSNPKKRHIAKLRKIRQDANDLVSQKTHG